jgi:hypothetical protein
MGGNWELGGNGSGNQKPNGDKRFRSNSLIPTPFLFFYEALCNFFSGPTEALLKFFF